MSLHIPNADSVDFRPPEIQNLDFEAKAVSWYTTKNALRSESGFCGQEESSLKYLHLPTNPLRVNFNLNRTHPGDNLKLEKYTDDEDISDLLFWIKEMHHLNEESISNAEFFCLRHELVDLMLMPYANVRFDVGIKMFVTKVEGKIYIRRICASDELKRHVTLGSFEQMRTKQGLIFQHYLISDSPHKSPVPDKPYVRGEKTAYVVFDGTVGEHKLIYSSKLKALDNPEDPMNLETATFTDVRTNMGSSSASIKWRKWLQFWANCITGKIERVAIGYVGEGATAGNVKKLEIIPSSLIIPKCQQSFKKDKYRKTDTPPSGDICLDTLDKVLTFLKVELRHAEPNEVYEFEFNPKESWIAKVQKVADSARGKYYVVPDWYSEWLKIKN